MARIIETEQPSIRLIIGTDAALPCVHLQLESLRRNCRDVSVLVHDNRSPQSRALKLLCDEYGTAFHSMPSRFRHVAGDLSAYLWGLAWADFTS